MKTLRPMTFIFLAAIYLATACTYSVNVLISSIPVSGAKAIVACDGESRDIPPKLTIQRRHMPLAKDIPCPSAHIGETEFPPITDELSIVVRLPFVKSFNAYYYSSFCDRAPPVA